MTNLQQETTLKDKSKKPEQDDTQTKGKIVVHNDEWTLSNKGFKNAPDTEKFVINVAKYFVGDKKGKFHVLSTNFGLTQSSLEQAMTKAGHTWSKGMNITVDVATLSQYDAIFIGGNAVDNQVLIEYVKNGGKVYLCAGTDAGSPKGEADYWNTFLGAFGLKFTSGGKVYLCAGDPKVEADRWNTFLGAFGLKFTGVYNNIVGNQKINQEHPLFEGVKALYNNSGNSIIDLQPNSPLNQVIMTHSSGQGLVATAEWIVSQDVPTKSEEPETPAVKPEPQIYDDDEFTITATQDVIISKLVYKGKVKRSQADEYVEITNKGNTPANISGWKITSAGKRKQEFIFPEGTILEGGESFRVYTNQVHPETGGFSFDSKTAIWNDAGDEAKLFDAQGDNVSTIAYGNNTIADIKKE